MAIQLGSSGLLCFARNDEGVKSLADRGISKPKFILSNLSKSALNNRLSELEQVNNITVDLNEIAVLYGGIGNDLELSLNTAAKTIPIEPVGVFVIGIDGLRQDVLYPPGQEDVQDPNGTYHVPLTQLPGLGKILEGHQLAEKDQQYIMLKGVTTVFPSLTLSSWASVFTGKQPNETGILGNEFFSRGTPIRAPERFNPPLGMISFGSGAFPGYDAFPKFRFSLGDTFPLLAGDFFVPRQSDWQEPVDPRPTPQNRPGILHAETIYEQLEDIPAVASRYENLGGDISVVAGSHYANGAYWLTGDVEPVLDESRFLDQSIWHRLSDYLCGKYYDALSDIILGCLGGSRNDVPFSAVTTWYLPGLDHEAHTKGMGVYRDYFINETDNYINQIVSRLKQLGEFDNKIYIVTADHGMTEMPADLIYRGRSHRGVEVNLDADTSCKYTVDFILPQSDSVRKRATRAEVENNNLHVWELANLFSLFPFLQTPIRLITPEEIAKMSIGATQDIDQGNLIGALNGPMAHIYVKGSSWQVDPDPILLGAVVERLEKVLERGGSAIGSFGEKIREHFPRLRNSVELILVRRSIAGQYEVVESVEEDATGQRIINSSPIDQYTFDSDVFVDASNRISGMNHENRSGDIVLVLKDMRDDVSQRYSSGLSCLSWHGGLNRSDSYVPFTMGYPGGNRLELEGILEKDSVCKADYGGCKENRKLPSVITEIIKKGYAIE